MESRSYWVDYAKAIGIVLVVYGHVARGLHTAGIGIPNGFYELANSIVYSFHMPLFFFLSGLFFNKSFSNGGAIRLISRKIDTVVYPYILWSIVQGMAEVALSGYTNGNTSYSEIFTLLWSPRAQFWFLYALFIAFVLASALFSMATKDAGVFVFFLSVVAYIYPSIMPGHLVFSLISQNFVFFVFGIVFSLHFKSEHLSNPLLLCVLGGGFAAGQFLFHHTFGLSYSDRGVASLLLAIVSILFVASASAWAALTPNRLWLFIGSCSMEIFLLHVLVASGVRVVLNKFLGVNSFAVHLVAGCLLGIGAPLLFLSAIRKLNIKYAFSAPLSELFEVSYSRAFPQKR